LWPKVVVFPQLEHFAMIWNPFGGVIASAKPEAIPHKVGFAGLLKIASRRLRRSQGHKAFA
jgi:hypothetical protein